MGVRYACDVLVMTVDFDPHECATPVYVWACDAITRTSHYFTNPNTLSEPSTLLSVRLSGEGGGGGGEHFALLTSVKCWAIVYERESTGSSLLNYIYPVL